LGLLLSRVGHEFVELELGGHAAQAERRGQELIGDQDLRDGGVGGAFVVVGISGQAQNPARGVEQGVLVDGVVPDHDPAHLALAQDALGLRP